jgi:hypothetical protein
MSPAFGSSFIPLRDAPGALGVGHAASCWPITTALNDHVDGVFCAAK